MRPARLRTRYPAQMEDGSQAGRTARRVFRRAAAGGATLLAVLLTPAPASAAIETAIRDAIASGPADPVGRAVRRVWEARGHAPRFVAPQPPFETTGEAREAIALLAEAPAHGLPAAAYRVSELRSALDAPRGEREAARLEAALAFSLARFYADVGFGRVDPRRLGYDLPQQRRREALVSAVSAALSGGSVRQALAELEPALPLYRSLREALPTWQARASGPQPPLLPPIRRAVAPGEQWSGVEALRARLAEDGEPALGPAQAAQDSRYDAGLVEAVRRFQARHGLTVDGVIGQQTLAALNVPAAARARQIALSLERLRWLGPLPRGRFVAVNIPEYRLWAVDGDRVVTTMAVVVGRAITGTPVFVDRIEAVEFNPYWNVPRSIAAKELWPKLARDPGWLDAQRMEWVGSVPRGVDPRAALAAGSVRLRQRPGPDNALGRVKFVMPNAHDVYLHDTPARTLFAAPQRAFSHGCVRLEHPLALAAFVLAGAQAWTTARMEAVIAEGATRVVAAPEPVPVLIFYSTVNIGADGRLRFLPDIYRLDATLDTALQTLGGEGAGRGP